MVDGPKEQDQCGNSIGQPNDYLEPSHGGGVVCQASIQGSHDATRGDLGQNINRHRVRAHRQRRSAQLDKPGLTEYCLSRKLFVRADRPVRALGLPLPLWLLR